MQHRLRKERCSYAIISFFFALSYALRFFFNVFVACNWTTFLIDILNTSVYLIEGSSMGILMIFHMKNFDGGTLMAETSSRLLMSGSIVNEKLHFFTS